jgi:integrase
MAWVEQRAGLFRVRLRLPDGTVVTDSAHPTKPAAQIRAKEIDVELAKETFLDPRDGKIPLREWVDIWQHTHQAGPATWSAYRSHLRLHILPRLGHLPLTSIRRQHIKALVIDLKTKLAPRSAADVLMVLSMVLREAVEDRRIPFNPARGVKVAIGHRPERPHATPKQVAEIIARIARHVDQILVLTAAYTGMRWGELTGLDRANLNLDKADIYIHPDVGALHEVDGKLFLGPPKTADSVRHVRLPDFLVQLLDELLRSHPYPTVFPGARGGFQRRSNFNRRAWTPAIDANPEHGLPAIVAGMHFHDLRHSHKTWLIEDGIPEIAQARRLGHRLPGVRGIYSHVTPAMEQAIADALQHRWATTTPSPANLPQPWDLDDPDLAA